MRSKGLFKAFYTPNVRFIFGKATPVTIAAEFTLSQCRVGWCKLWNCITIHLLFVDIIINYLRLDTRETARNYIACSKETDKRIKGKIQDLLPRLNKGEKK